MGGPSALVALEDGTVLRGTAFAGRGEAFGEAVFNTAMCGYQEVLTDPSYAGQVVVMTAPQQGNYGTNRADPESGRIQVAGFVVREESRRAWSWRAERTLAEELEAAGIPGVEGVDTRRLTLRIREQGAMRCGISTEDLDPSSLLARVRERPGMAGADLARTVSAGEPYEARELVGPADRSRGPVFRVAVYDLGLKRSILRLLARAGLEATVFPAETPAEEVLDGDHHGVFLSNGPGDPAATAYGIRAARAALEAGAPLLGICLGHQLLGLALGGRTYKMKFGHRGANQPVVDLETGRVQITSHNHGFAVDPRSLLPDGGPAPDRGWPAGGTRPGGAPRGDTPFGRVALTHWNLNDGTLEGLRCLDRPALSVQYHPEAAPGPHDARPVFDAFRRLLEAS